MDWICQNIGNIVVGMAVFAAVLGAVIKIKTSDKKTGCAGGCGGCPCSGFCGKERVGYDVEGIENRTVRSHRCCRRRR